jgi:hypothetical protein
LIGAKSLTETVSNREIGIAMSLEEASAIGLGRRHLEDLCMLHQQTAFLFDLDGTLIDSVYQHAIA